MLEAWLALVRPPSPMQLALFSLATSDDDMSSELEDSECSWVFDLNSEEESTDSAEAKQHQV